MAEIGPNLNALVQIPKDLRIILCKNIVKISVY